MIPQGRNFFFSIRFPTWIVDDQKTPTPQGRQDSTSCRYTVIFQPLYCFQASTNFYALRDGKRICLFYWLSFVLQRRSCWFPPSKMGGGVVLSRSLGRQTVSTRILGQHWLRRRRDYKSWLAFFWEGMSKTRGRRDPTECSGIGWKSACRLLFLLDFNTPTHINFSALERESEKDNGGIADNCHCQKRVPRISWVHQSWLLSGGDLILAWLAGSFFVLGWMKMRDGTNEDSRHYPGSIAHCGFLRHTHTHNTPKTQNINTFFYCYPGTRIQLGMPCEKGGLVAQGIDSSRQAKPGRAAS